MGNNDTPLLHPRSYHPSTHRVSFIYPISSLLSPIPPFSFIIYHKSLFSPISSRISHLSHLHTTLISHIASDISPPISPPSPPSSIRHPHRFICNGQGIPDRGKIIIKTIPSDEKMISFCSSGPLLDHHHRQHRCHILILMAHNHPSSSSSSSSHGQEVPDHLRCLYVFLLGLFVGLHDSFGDNCDGVCVS